MKHIGFVMSLLAMVAPGAAAAATRDDVVQGIVRCGALADDRQWLDCLYGAAQPMRAQLGLPPAPQAQQKLVPMQGYGTLPGYGGTAMPAPVPRAAPPAQYARPQERGFFERMMGEANVPAITDRMQSYQFDGQGLFTVTLANGQTWKQIADETHIAHWTKPARSYTVTISPGAFGSFNLIVNEESRAYKVKRVR